MYGLIKAFVLPPGVLITLALIVVLAALFLKGAWARRSVMAAAAALGALYVLSIPVVADLALKSIETPALPVNEAVGADAIVILSAGARRYTPEFGFTPEVDGMTLLRLRYGAFLHRKTDLPVLVTGGPPEEGVPSIGETMRRTLARDFGVEAKWVERRARNTHENARYTAEILCPLGLNDIVIVTQSWHAPRAKAEFERFGFTVRVAGTDYTNHPFKSLEPNDFLPSHKAFQRMHYALHERIGRIWYAATRSAGSKNICAAK